MLRNGLYCYITCLCGRPLCSETPAKLSQLTFMQWSDVSFMPHPCKRQVSLTLRHAFTFRTGPPSGPSEESR